MAERIERANRLLSADNATAMFVTAFHGVLDLKSGALRYCNAGHNPPYLLRVDGASERLPATGVPFGVDGDLPYRLAEATLRPGDALFLYSDGITEAFNSQGEEFGAARLEAALAAARGQAPRRLSQCSCRDNRVRRRRRSVRRHHRAGAGLSALIARFLQA